MDSRAWTEGLRLRHEEDVLQDLGVLLGSVQDPEERGWLRDHVYLALLEASARGRGEWYCLALQQRILAGDAGAVRSMVEGMLSCRAPAAADEVPAGGPGGAPSPAAGGGGGRADRVRSVLKPLEEGIAAVLEPYLGQAWPALLGGSEEDRERRGRFIEGLRRELEMQVIHFLMVQPLVEASKTGGGEGEEDDAVQVGLLPGEAGAPARSVPVSDLLRRAGPAGRGRTPDAGTRLLWYLVDEVFRQVRSAARPEVERIGWSNEVVQSVMDGLVSLGQALRHILGRPGPVPAEDEVRQEIEARTAADTRDSTTIARQIRRARKMIDGEPGNGEP